MKNESREQKASLSVRRAARQSSIRSPQSAISRLWREESGQGILFAAATLLVLVGFVAFVFNIGRLLDRRTKMQIAADAAAYSGAMVEANAVSAIAWINSAMSQVYYNAMSYAKDVDMAAVAAELERRMNPNGAPGGAAWDAYQMAYSQAATNLPMAKLWMVQLSQLENAIAIVTPRLAEEEMFAVAGRAGAERMSVYPSFRMFPSQESRTSFSITCLGNGWKIVNLNTGETLTISLNGNTWDIQWSNDPSPREVQISQDSPTRWHVQYFQPPGSPVQEVFLENDPGLGWVVWGSSPGVNGGPPVTTPPITFTTVDMDGDGLKEGTRITQGGYSQVAMRGADGNVYVWNDVARRYDRTTSNQTTVGGVNVQVNVTNTIHFAGGATARIGQPTVVDIGGTHLVLTDPPNISTGFGPVRIAISGFSPTQFNISVGGFSLTPGNSNGRWTDHYDPREEIWWRTRLVVMGTDLNGRPNQWQYDYERFGALLRWESNGYITRHAFMGQGFSPNPNDWPTNPQTQWTAWFNTDPVQAKPVDESWQPENQPDTDFSAPDGSGIRHLLPNILPPAGAYYQTATCAHCSGTGKEAGGGVCAACRARDYFGNSRTSNVRVSIGSLANSPFWPNGLRRGTVDQPFPAEADYLDARVYNSSSYGVIAPPLQQMMPLVATEEFFKWGVNIGVWKHAYNGSLYPNDTPMLFPNSREPAWGTVAIASARVGLPDGSGGHIWQFNNKPNRSNWCQASLLNLYYADVQAKLYASKYQVSDFDLDDEILQGMPVNAIDESGLSYLWTAILASNRISRNTWMDRFNGQSDPRVGGVLRNMQNSQGGPLFDYGSAELNQVVQH
jgi:hypothetical protein